MKRTVSAFAMAALAIGLLLAAPNLVPAPGVAQEDPAQVRMVAFELFAPPADSGGGG